MSRVFHLKLTFWEIRVKTAIFPTVYNLKYHVVFLNVAYTGLQLGSSQTFSAPLDITIFINIIKVNILSLSLQVDHGFIKGKLQQKLGLNKRIIQSLAGFLCFEKKKHHHHRDRVRKKASKRERERVRERCQHSIIIVLCTDKIPPYHERKIKLS